jgi:hypothetical protein
MVLSLSCYVRGYYYFGSTSVRLSNSNVSLFFSQCVFNAWSECSHFLKVLVSCIYTPLMVYFRCPCRESTDIARCQRRAFEFVFVSVAHHVLSSATIEDPETYTRIVSALLYHVHACYVAHSTACFISLSSLEHEINFAHVPKHSSPT